MDNGYNQSTKLPFESVLGIAMGYLPKLLDFLPGVAVFDAPLCVVVVPVNGRLCCDDVAGFFR